jgi:hypothetical protein
VGGITGTGTPSLDEWGGIAVSGSGSIELERAKIEYAETGFSSTTDEDVTVQSDVFAHNAKAVDIAATLGTNAAIHGTWFDENGLALAGTSNWTGIEPTLDGVPLEACRYLPEISATKNTFGPKSSHEPSISLDEKEDIEHWQLVPLTAEWPENWTQSVQVGIDDRIEWSALLCQPVDVETGLPSGLPHEVVATPFEIGE